MPGTEQELLPQDYIINDLTLYPKKGKPIELQNVVVEINIYEDLFNNTTHGSLVIMDATNLLANVPITGFETLHVDFMTPNKLNYEKTFRIYKITDRNIVREKTMVYILDFTSQEMLNGEKNCVQKSYRAKQISEIVQDIHLTYLESAQTLYIEPTKYLHSLIVPNLPAFKAINWLSIRANSQRYLGSDYVYYEDHVGFNFRTIQDLIENNPSRYQLCDHVISKRIDSKTHQRDYALESITMQSYKILNHIDVLQNVTTGMYGNTLLTHDINHKSWSKYIFDYRNTWGSFVHLDRNPLISQTDSNDYANSEIKLYSSSEANEYPNKVKEWLPTRISQMEQLQNIRVNCAIPGNTDLTVGQTIELNIFSPEPAKDDQQPLDLYYQGQYLITSVRHTIANHKYVTYLEMVKDSVFSPIP